MNKGYAFGFLIILLIVMLGLYVAFTGFRAARQAQQVQALAAPTERPGEATRRPTRIAPTPTETIFLITGTLPAVTDTAVPTPTTEPTATAEPDQPTSPPKKTAAPTQPKPRPTPAPAFQFRVLSSRPDPGRGGCCYIFGTVRDAGGNPLEGVRVQLANQWTAPVTALTKGGTDLGKYDFPIGPDKVTWYVSVVDGAGNRISTEAVVEFDVGVAGQYQVDWQRTY